MVLLLESQSDHWPTTYLGHCQAVLNLVFSWWHWTLEIKGKSSNYTSGHEVLLE